MNNESDQTKKLEEEFKLYINEIELLQKSFKKHEQIRINQWLYALCKEVINIEWKKNRNRHAMLLLDQLLNQRLDKPFTGIPSEGGLALLTPYDLVLHNIYNQKSKLSQKSHNLKLNKKYVDDRYKPFQPINNLSSTTLTRKSRTNIKLPLERKKQGTKAGEGIGMKSLEVLRLQSEIDVMKVALKQSKEELKVLIYT